MADLSAMLSSQEGVEVLKQRVVTMTYELEIMQAQKEEEVRKHRESMEDMKQLLDLLQQAQKERDEARQQLRKLLGSLPPTAPPESPLLVNYGRTSSGAADSNSFSDTAEPYTAANNNNNLSQGDSLYDIISAPPPRRPDTGKAIADAESRVVSDLAKRKPLPQKGKLMEAVLEAGPLLKALMVAAPLPRWRVPPPAQPLQVETLPVDFDNESVPPSLRKPFNTLASGFGSSDLLFNSALTLSGTGTGLTSARGMVSPPPANGLSQIFATPKRQRIQ